MLKDALHAKQMPVTNIGNNQFLTTVDGVNYIISITGLKTDHGQVLIRVHKLSEDGRSVDTGETILYEPTNDSIFDPESGYQVYLNVQKHKDGKLPPAFEFKVDVEESNEPVAINVLVDLFSTTGVMGFFGSNDDEDKKKKKKKEKKGLDLKRLSVMSLVMGALTGLGNVIIQMPKLKQPARTTIDMTNISKNIVNLELLQNPIIDKIPVVQPRSEAPGFSLPMNPDTSLRVNPDTSLPIQPVMSLPLKPGMSLPIQPDTSLRMNPDLPAPLPVSGKSTKPVLKIDTQTQKNSPVFTNNTYQSPIKYTSTIAFVPPLMDKNINPFGVPREYQRPETIHEFISGSITSVFKADPNVQQELLDKLDDVDVLSEFMDETENNSKITITFKLPPLNSTQYDVVSDTLKRHSIHLPQSPPPLPSVVLSSEEMINSLIDTVLVLSGKSNKLVNARQLIECLLHLKSFDVPEATKVLFNAYQILEKEDPTDELKVIYDTFVPLRSQIAYRNLPKIVTTEADERTLKNIMLTVDAVKSTTSWATGAVGNAIETYFKFDVDLDYIMKEYVVPVGHVVQSTLAKTINKNPVEIGRFDINYDAQLVLYTEILNMLQKVGDSVMSTIAGINSPDIDLNLGSLSMNHNATILKANLTSTERLSNDISMMLMSKTPVTNVPLPANRTELRQKVESTYKNTLKSIQNTISDPHFDTIATKNVTSSWLYVHPGYLDLVKLKHDQALHATNGVVDIAKEIVAIAKKNNQPITKMKKKPIVMYLKKNPYLAMTPDYNDWCSKKDAPPPGMSKINKQSPYLVTNPDYSDWSSKNDAPPPGMCRKHYLRHDNFELPFVAEVPFDVTLHPPLAIKFGTVKFPNSFHTYSKKDNFYNDVHTSTKAIKWHSTQVDVSILNILDDTSLEHVQKHMMITRLVCTVYLQRRGKNTTVMDDPVEEAIKDAGSLVNVFTRSLDPYVLDLYLEFSNSTNVQTKHETSVPAGLSESATLLLGSLFQYVFSGSSSGSTAPPTQPYPLSQVMTGDDGKKVVNIVKPWVSKVFYARKKL